MQFVRIGLVMAIAGNVMKIFAPTNLVVLTIGNLLAGVGASTLTMICGYFIIQYMDHIEWQSRKRVEGMANAI